MKKIFEEIIGRLPFEVLILAAVAYFGYEYYAFHYEDGSELKVKEAQVVTLKEQNAVLDKKVKDGEAFYRSLDQKKVLIREYAKRLDEAKATLSEGMDTPQLMKSVITEAKKSGLTVVSLKPTENVTKEHYVEQHLEFKFKGAFVQLLILLDRLANLKQIVQPDAIDLKPLSANPGSRFVTLDGKLDLKTFRYQETAADEIGKKKEGT